MEDEYIDFEDAKDLETKERCCGYFSSILRYDTFYEDKKLYGKLKGEGVKVQICHNNKMKNGFYPQIQNEALFINGEGELVRICHNNKMKNGFYPQIHNEVLFINNDLWWSDVKVKRKDVIDYIIKDRDEIIKSILVYRAENER